MSTWQVELDCCRQAEALIEALSMTMSERFNGIRWLVRQRAFYMAILLWLLLCGVGLLFSRHTPSYSGLVVGSSQYLVLVVLMFGLVGLLTRKRPVIDLAQRAPESSIARLETLAMWAYVAVVIVSGRLIGQHLLGEGIALHLNGSLVGATRVQSAIEVYTWADYNRILLALIPYLVFRMRGYSNEQLNLKSANLKSDLLVIMVVLAFSARMDMMGSNIFQLTRHQQPVGGVMSFWLHLFRTDLPIMLVLGQGAEMALLGIGIGVLLALGLTRLIASQLYGVTPHDKLTFGGAGLVLAVAALAACYIPARRAMNVDPVAALRYG
jgi:hypothetical protein